MMKRIYLLIIVLFLVLFLNNCGIKQEKYDKVVIKNKLLTDEISKLNEKIIILEDKLDFSTVKANLSRLKESLSEYISGKIDKTENIIKIIKLIDPKNKSNKISKVYNNNSGLIINTFLSILESDREYNDKIVKYLNKLKSIKKEIQNKKDRIAELSNNGYEYCTFVIIRKFDYDSYSGKGYYESYKLSYPKKVVLIAKANEVNLSPIGSRRKLVVKSLGERKTTVIESNAYRSTNVYEYYNYYETVGRSKNPYLVKEKLVKIESEYIKLQKEFSENKLVLLKDYTEKIKANIKKIIVVL